MPTYNPLNALILGGNSPHNKEWIRQVKAALTPLFGQIVTHDYAHWASAGAAMDFDHELRAIQREIQTLSDYIVFAKSAGVLLCLQGMAQNILRPGKVVFLGTPLSYIRQQALGDKLDDWLKRLPVPMLAIQNAQDPVGSAKELNRYLKALVLPSRVTFVALPGQTHDYTDFPKLYELTCRFRSKK